MKESNVPFDPNDAELEPHEDDVAAVTAPKDEPEVVDSAVPEPAATPQPQRLSDYHCPKLVRDEDILRRPVVERLTNAEGDVVAKLRHRVPEQVVVDPMECPSCGKLVEKHMLVLDNMTGRRDCAIAVQERANPNYTARFGADAEKAADADADARKDEDKRDDGGLRLREEEGLRDGV